MNLQRSGTNLPTDRKTPECRTKRNRGMEFGRQECVQRLAAQFLRPVRGSSSDEKCIDTRNTRQRSREKGFVQEEIVQSCCGTRQSAPLGIALTLFGWLMPFAIPSPQRLARSSGEYISPVRSHP